METCLTMRQRPMQVTCDVEGAAASVDPGDPEGRAVVRLRVRVGGLSGDDHLAVRDLLLLHDDQLVARLGRRLRVYVIGREADVAYLGVVDETARNAELAALPAAGLEAQLWFGTGPDSVSVGSRPRALSVQRMEPTADHSGAARSCSI